MSDTILAAAARANAQAFGYDIRPGRALGMTGLDADRYFAANECDDFGVALSRGVRHRQQGLVGLHDARRPRRRRPLIDPRASGIPRGRSATCSIGCLGRFPRVAAVASWAWWRGARSSSCCRRRRAAGAGDWFRRCCGRCCCSRRSPIRIGRRSRPVQPSMPEWPAGVIESLPQCLRLALRSRGPNPRFVGFGTGSYRIRLRPLGLRFGPVCPFPLAC